MSIWINLEAGTGDSIQDTAVAMTEVARRTGTWVKTDFNGRTLIAHGGTPPEEIVTDYRRWIERERNQSKKKEEVEALDQESTPTHLMDAARLLYRELLHLVQLLEPLEVDGSLHVPGLATLNGAREALTQADPILSYLREEV